MSAMTIHRTKVYFFVAIFDSASRALLVHRADTEKDAKVFFDRTESGNSFKCMGPISVINATINGKRQYVVPPPVLTRYEGSVSQADLDDLMANVAFFVVHRRMASQQFGIGASQ